MLCTGKNEHYRKCSASVAKHTPRHVDHVAIVPAYMQCLAIRLVVIIATAAVVEWPPNQKKVHCDHVAAELIFIFDTSRYLLLLSALVGSL